MERVGEDTKGDIVLEGVIAVEEAGEEEEEGVQRPEGTNRDPLIHFGAVVKGYKKNEDRFAMTEVDCGPLRPCGCTFGSVLVIGVYDGHAHQVGQVPGP